MNVCCTYCGTIMGAELAESHRTWCRPERPQYDHDGAGDAYQTALDLASRLGGVTRRIKNIDEAAPLRSLLPPPPPPPDHEAAETCPVCLEAPASGARRVVRACGHAFCDACITRWLSEKVTCPVCVRDLSETCESELVDVPGEGVTEGPVVRLRLVLLERRSESSRRMHDLLECVRHLGAVADILSRAAAPRG